ncbi:MAG TPA: hypothetical protein VFD39_04575 [Trueperaceae bacterium]|nr:hypothetical protein [Trueperaceae bacterium]
MTAVAPLAIERWQAAAQGPAADEIGNAATLISITLAVLSAFAGQRAASLREQEATGVGHHSHAQLRSAFLLDVALAGFGVLLLL